MTTSHCPWPVTLIALPKPMLQSQLPSQPPCCPTRQQPKETLAAFSTTAEVDGLIAAALADYSTTAGVNGLIATALADYSTTAQVNGLIATAVGGIDLSNYYERAETYSQAEVNSVVSGQAIP